MGLDAVVYKSIANVRVLDPLDVGAICLDEETGEVYLDPPGLGHLRREDVIAVKKRLGNISLIAFLRDNIRRVLSATSVILSKVLYDGTHSGDIIYEEDIELLAREIHFLKIQNIQKSDELLEFISDMEALVAAAREQGNPIVFR